MPKKIFNDKSLRLDCYNLKGVARSVEGNGKWIMYDKDFKNIVVSGQVKAGLMEGEWHGRIMDDDSTRYTNTYYKGIFKSGVGSDKSGIAYPFTHDKGNTLRSPYRTSFI